MMLVGGEGQFYAIEVKCFAIRNDSFARPVYSMKSAINMAWEHGGADFQSRFDKTTAQAEQMKSGALRVL